MTSGIRAICRLGLHLQWQTASTGKKGASRLLCFFDVLCNIQDALCESSAIESVGSVHRLKAVLSLNAAAFCPQLQGRNFHVGTPGTGLCTMGPYMSALANHEQPRRKQHRNPVPRAERGRIVPHCCGSAEHQRSSVALDRCSGFPCQTLEADRGLPP